MALGSMFPHNSKFKVHIVLVVVLLVWGVVIGGSIFYSRSSKVIEHHTIPSAFTDSKSELVDNISKEEDCSKRPYIVEPKAQFDVAKKIAFISRHVGTTADFRYMAYHLQLENVEFLDCKSWFGFRDTKEKYASLVKSGKRDEICSQYDAIFISDTLSDGWPFIMGEHKCKNVHFVVTNRFDYGVRDDEQKDFHDDVSRALNRKDGYNLKLVVNNLFEIPFMESRGVVVPEKDKSPLIRPFGFTTLAASKEEVNKEPCLLIGRVDQDKELMHLLVKKHTGHDCKVLVGQYGGPRTLSRYHSIVVHLPYQVSIMKMWENLNYGTLMAIPSPKFFTKICNENTCGQTEHVFETKKVFKDTWHEYVDFYLPGWEKCFVQFDSWDHLKDIIEKREYVNDINTCRDMMLDMRDENLKQWKKVFNDFQ
ncbi:CIC11C00000000193 [Sungouiella intermedia]|uniref:CIC11C00000000193 n=1 Tax=Sungouiella intermedia TaxID=45354 RepID=A0A1L0C4Q0_9ASCO|nr:CIC11C00000000193 [[Candida] intermedia]